MTKRERRDVYQEVTDRIVEALERDEVAPWHRPWTSVGGPYNIHSGRPYRGINIFLLELMGYGDPRWGSFKRMKEAAVAHALSEGREIVEVEDPKKARVTHYEIVNGERVLFQGGVRKGEHATRVILWKPIHRELPEGDERPKDYLLLRDYAVFNAEQADGLPPLDIEEREHTPDEAAEALVVGYGNRPPIHYGGDMAAYSPFMDEIRMPTPERFESSAAFYSTEFHELVHSTGHENRLKRIETALFGTDPYAKEELVAEMGAAMLCGLSGQANEDQSAAYVKTWADRLRGDKKLVIGAAAQAQKAVDYMTGVTFEEKTEPEKEEVAA